MEEILARVGAHTVFELVLYAAGALFALVTTGKLVVGKFSLRNANGQPRKPMNPKYLLVPSLIGSGTAFGSGLAILNNAEVLGGALTGGGLAGIFSLIVAGIAMLSKEQS